MHFFHVISLGPGIYHMKSLKIPKGQSESVNRRRTDNTMTIRINNDLQNATQKTKYRATQTPLKPGVNSGLRKG